MSHHFGAKVAPGEKREYGKAMVSRAKVRREEGGGRREGGREGGREGRGSMAMVRRAKVRREGGREGGREEGREGERDERERSACYDN